MRQFASTGFRLWNLGLEAKVLYSAFCVFTLLGIVSSALYYGDLVGGRLTGVRRYYAGEDTGSALRREGVAAGPLIDVPADVEGERQPLVVPITYRKLLEVTHFHLFTLPVVLLIVGHLFLATGLGPRAKLAWVSLAAITVTLHLATPWLVRYLTPGLAALHALSGAAMTLAMTVLTVCPVFAMWRRPPEN